ncbi:MAG: hypothetical protein ACRDUX_37980, partial [Mycobacterium sp.]
MSAPEQPPTGRTTSRAAAPIEGATATHSKTSAQQQELRLPGLLIGSVIVVGAFGLLFAALVQLSPHLPGYGTPYVDWMKRVQLGDGLARVQWALGDMTEPQFYKSWIASLGLLAGTAIA